jgi:hypothetical protein
MIGTAFAIATACCMHGKLALRVTISVREIIKS